MGTTVEEALEEFILRTVAKISAGDPRLLQYSIGVVGMGDVGIQIASTLAQEKQVEELWIQAMEWKEAEAWKGLIEGETERKNLEIKARKSSSLDELLENADILFFAASGKEDTIIKKFLGEKIPQAFQEGSTCYRLGDLPKTIDSVVELARALNKQAQKDIPIPLVFVVSNPTDFLAYALAKMTGLHYHIAGFNHIDQYRLRSVVKKDWYVAILEDLDSFEGMNREGRDRLKILLQNTDMESSLCYGIHGNTIPVGMEIRKRRSREIEKDRALIDAFLTDLHRFIDAFAPAVRKKFGEKKGTHYLRKQIGIAAREVFRNLLREEVSFLSVFGRLEEFIDPIDDEKREPIFFGGPVRYRNGRFVHEEKFRYDIEDREKEQIARTYTSALPVAACMQHMVTMAGYQGGLLESPREDIRTRFAEKIERAFIRNIREKILDKAERDPEIRELIGSMVDRKVTCTLEEFFSEGTIRAIIDKRITEKVEEKLGPYRLLSAHADALPDDLHIIVLALARYARGNVNLDDIRSSGKMRQTFDAEILMYLAIDKEVMAIADQKYKRDGLGRLQYRCRCWELNGRLIAEIPLVKDPEDVKVYDGTMYVVQGDELIIGKKDGTVQRVKVPRGVSKIAPLPNLNGVRLMLLDVENGLLEYDVEEKRVVRHLTVQSVVREEIRSFRVVEDGKERTYWLQTEGGVVIYRESKAAHPVVLRNTRLYDIHRADNRVECVLVDPMKEPTILRYASVSSIESLLQKPQVLQQQMEIPGHVQAAKLYGPYIAAVINGELFFKRKEANGPFRPIKLENANLGGIVCLA